MNVWSVQLSQSHKYPPSLKETFNKISEAISPGRRHMYESDPLGPIYGYSKGYIPSSWTLSVTNFHSKVINGLEMCVVVLSDRITEFWGIEILVGPCLENCLRDICLGIWYQSAYVEVIVKGWSSGQQWSFCGWYDDDDEVIDQVLNANGTLSAYL